MTGVEVGSSERSDDAAVHPITLAVDRVDEAERALRVHLRHLFGLGETDLLAVQLIDRAQRAGRAAHVSDISRRFGLSSGAATEVVNRLERRRLLRRVPDPDDLRVRVLLLTEETTTRLAESTGPIRDATAQLLQSLTTGESALVVELLDRVRRIIEASTP